MKLRMIPYGYKVNNGKVEPDETERKIVQRIFHNYIIGKGLKTIADMLTSEEVPEPCFVRFAFSNWHCINLYNCEGLPAIPFRTDSIEYR